MRIKVNKGRTTTDKSIMSSFPINTSGPFPTINEKKIKYGDKLSNLSIALKKVDLEREKFLSKIV